MTEQFANFAISSLSAPITAKQTTINIATPTPGQTFPTLGNFRIVVQSFDVTTQIPTSAPELMLVTAVAGNKFTVQRGIENTQAIAFASGAQVTHIVTAGVMQALEAEAGVSSLNGETGALNLVAGSNIIITPSGTNITIASSGGGGSVSSVSNSDGSLTITPTSGAVVASLNTAHNNTWTGTQLFGEMAISPSHIVDPTNGNAGLYFDGGLTVLKGSNGNTVVDFSSGNVNDSNGASSLDASGRAFYDELGNMVASYHSQTPSSTTIEAFFVNNALMVGPSAAENSDLYGGGSFFEGQFSVGSLSSGNITLYSVATQDSVSTTGINPCGVALKIDGDSSFNPVFTISATQFGVSLLPIWLGEGGAPVLIGLPGSGNPDFDGVSKLQAYGLSTFYGNTRFVSEVLDGSNSPGAAGQALFSTGTATQYQTTPSILKTTTGINGKTIANTSLYTVPTGKTAVITGYNVRCSAVAGTGTGAAAGLGNVAGTNNISASQAMNALTTTSSIFQWQVIGMSLVTATGSSIFFNLGTGYTGTSQTLVVDLIGYLV